ncbi:MAG: HD domain-containing phosphohydrolase [Candidatus Gastranaerophilaceae bacterium]|jgi:HD-GYP domain-containing protein (c-di-GMP phosphodiesterase class II)/Tfp pilus assembly protein PilF
MIENLVDIKNKSEQALLEKIESIEDLSQKADSLFEIALIVLFKKNYSSAFKYLELAQKYYSQMHDIPKVASCLAEQALIHYHQNRNRIIRAHTLLNDANYLIVNLKSDKSNEIQAKILHYYGIISYHEKNFAEALDYYKKAAKLVDKQSLTYAEILDSMGLFYLRSANFYVANNYLQESVKIKSTKNDYLKIASTRILIGRYYFNTENYDEALVELEKALKITESYSDVLTTLRIYDELIKTYIITEDLDNAEKFLQKAFEISKDYKDTGVYAFLCCTYASFLLKKNDIEKVKNVLSQNIKNIFKDQNSLRGLAFVKQIEAQIYKSCKNEEAAVEALHEAIEHYRTIKLYLDEAKSYFELAKIYHALNDTKMTISSLLEALRIANTNELSLLTKKIEDFLYDIDPEEWASIINKTAKKEKIFEESKSLLETLDLLGSLQDDTLTGKDPLLALLRLGRSIAAQTDIDKLIEVIAEETKNALNADRCTVFLIDTNSNELWSKVALGMGSQEIRFPANMGLAGHVAITGETINIKNAYVDPRFNKEIDKKTGYKTKTILCMPIRNINHEIIGVFQVLNKQGRSYFTNDDEDLLIAIGSSAGIALENARLFTKQQQMLEEQKRSFISFINTLARSIDARDKITSGHSLRVTKYTALISNHMKMSDKDIEILEHASLLHDIGKIGIKDSVLCKEGKLTFEEYKHIQEHVKITYEILLQMYFTEDFKDVPEIASAHHEKYDGSGYFRGTKEEDIHIGGRILAVSDVFDAITSKRHYRDRMPIKDALEILKTSAGSHFDPKIINQFFEISTDKILEILISAYDKNLSTNEKSYFSKFSINDFYIALNKEVEERSKNDNKLIKNFEKFYLNL